MKKFMNDPKNFVDEMLEGIYLANKEVTYVADDKRCYVKAEPVKGKVGIATGGGSGHLPLFLGYVGKGMLDGAAVGGVFQSPSAEQMLEVPSISIRGRVSFTFTAIIPGISSISIWRPSWPTLKTSR
jgi:dihydroxyacetone kinase-like protein